MILFSFCRPTSTLDFLLIFSSLIMILMRMIWEMIRILLVPLQHYWFLLVVGRRLIVRILPSLSSFLRLRGNLWSGRILISMQTFHELVHNINVCELRLLLVSLLLCDYCSISCLCVATMSILFLVFRCDRHLLGITFSHIGIFVVLCARSLDCLRLTNSMFLWSLALTFSRCILCSALCPSLIWVSDLGGSCIVKGRGLDSIRIASWKLRAHRNCHSSLNIF
jgi:hypothetical protein